MNAVAAPFHSPDSHIETRAPSAIVQQTDNSRLLPYLIGCAVGVGFACALSCFTLWQAWIAERDARTAFVAVTDQNALMLREGILCATDITYGPGNNLEYGLRGDGCGRNHLSNSTQRNPSIQQHPH